MKCPVCKDVDLLMSERQGIEIDYCPQCRGVWLDRGELDRLIERSHEGAPAPAAAASQRPASQRADVERHYRDDDYRQRRRKSFLGEIFDFD
ncbi:MAG: zf-TFIIB domain-containing protein [Hydrogenophilaceae bacterium]|nr:zf-TFIIB domain-containing protein [Hydrogenophilaceae bacterium]